MTRLLACFHDFCVSVLKTFNEANWIKEIFKSVINVSASENFFAWFKKNELLREKIEKNRKKENGDGKI